MLVHLSKNKDSISGDITLVFTPKTGKIPLYRGWLVELIARIRGLHLEARIGPKHGRTFSRIVDGSSIAIAVAVEEENQEKVDT